MSERYDVSQIKGTLAAQAEADVAPVDLWPRIAVMAGASGGVVSRRRVSRLAWAAMAVFGLALLSGTAYAVEPVRQAVEPVRKWFFGSARGAQAVEEFGLAHPVGVSQTVDGVTMTVDYVYVDEERVFIGLRGSAPHGLAPVTRNVWLASEGETRYVFPHERTEPKPPDEATPVPGTGGKLRVTRVIVSGQSGREVADPAFITETPTPGISDWWISSEWGESNGVAMLSFTSNSNITVYNTLPMHLRFYARLATPDVNVWQAFVNGPLAERASESCTPDGCIVGPFDFRFDVPVTGGPEIPIGQSETVNGQTVELRRVYMRTQTTGVVLAFTPPTSENWAPSAALQTSWGATYAAGGGQSMWSPDGKRSSVTSLGNGEWLFEVTHVGVGNGQQSFTVTSLEVLDVTGTVTKRIEGPWTFEFETVRPRLGAYTIVDGVRRQAYVGQVIAQGTKQPNGICSVPPIGMSGASDGSIAVAVTEECEVVVIKIGGSARATQPGTNVVTPVWRTPEVAYPEGR
ncbi:MAG: DUF4179 domain-containing protein [SAR202 cluster bacterium]|nr:DUF4179 domain-containing protein [SAR202 cluster bacterium]